MSIHEIQPQFGTSSPKFKVDPTILERGLFLLLNDIVLGRNIAVDVIVQDTLSDQNEWRICIPPNERDLYRVISNILTFKDAVYSAHVQKGTMKPREFIVNVWCRSHKDNAIIGSGD